LNLKTELVNCVKDLYTLGLNTAISGNHSVRFERIWMWITPSEVPRYKMRSTDLIRVNIKTKAIVHCHSPYTLGISISSRFEEALEEAKIIVGDPVIIEDVPSGSVELASNVSKCFEDNRVRAVIIKNHGVVAIGKNLDKARSVVESLEEWSKVLTVCKIFNTKYR
jgi:ribulose-5-phosphate 4-epimerase/fuculose-1-phosphate aldolase